MKSPLMQAFFGLVCLAQLGAAGYLWYIDGWIGALAFWIVTAVFIGLMARVAELAERLWRRLFGATT
jgi:hypothetical protein